MGKTSKEKQKEYYARIKSDPVKRAAYLEKRRAAYKEKKEQGNIKCISDLTRRDQKLQRKERKRRSREKSKLKNKVLMTPSTPDTQTSSCSSAVSSSLRTQ